MAGHDHPHPHPPDFEFEPMEHMDKIHWLIENRGWAVEPVRPDPSSEPPRPSYSYTLGLEALIGHPEIVIMGLAPVAASGLLDLVVANLRAGVQIPRGRPFVGLLDHDLRAVLTDVSPETHGWMFPTLGEIYGDQPWRMTQFVWPDRSGAFPWEPEWPAAMVHTQPVLR
ncbi:MAG TPA: DUF4262 domain-containing protein [Acidimicrobiales bacterium]|nr:DUF4262 domain-containing protein [Acidimicrobiales bacterium]